jgi:short-subunit dehydrogenase
VKNALVTGASSGIGAATARRLAAGGWRVVLVARRAELLERLAAELPGARALPLDLTADGAPARAAGFVDEELGGELHLLVNNAGAAWRSSFADGGYENVRRTMELNFDALVRLTEALLPRLRASAPSSLVNVSSVAGRVGLAKTGAYAASKFALAGWTEALRLEEAGNGVHVGLVLPGFIRTEGFPQKEVPPRLVSTPEKAAAAIVKAGPGGKAERYVPRAWALVPKVRYLLPGLWRRSAGRARR